MKSEPPLIFIAEKNKNSEEIMTRHQVHKHTESHQRNLAKQKEESKWKEALEIDDDYVEGAAFDKDLQEKKKAERMEQRLQRELERKVAEEKKKVFLFYFLCSYYFLKEDEERREKERKKKEREERKERERKVFYSILSFLIL